MSVDDDSAPPRSSDAKPAAPAAPRRHRLAAWFAGAAAAIATLVAISAGALFWALHHAAGSAWLLGLVPGLTVVEPQGALLGDFAAARIVYVVGDAGELRLDAPRWQGLVASAGDHGRWLHLSFATLHADRVLWAAHSPPRSTAASTPPRSLRLPIELEVDEASVDELRIGSADAAPVQRIRARVHLGADGGAQHRFDAIAASIERGSATGALTIGSDAPLPVAASVDAVATAGDWSVAVRGSGPLDALEARATVRAAATASHAAQSLDARATLRPFAPWPLGALDASVSGLDLSAFASALPATALTGSAAATTSGMDVPATISIDLANARAGRWNEGLLPVRRVRAELRARPQALTAIDVQTLSAELGSAAAAAGSVVGHGGWAPDGWRIDAELRQVRPAALDARAAEAIVSGRATVIGSADGQASGVASSRAPASTPRANSATAPTTTPVTATHIELEVDLAGELTDRRLPRTAPRSARLRGAARLAANELVLQRAEATLGTARATLEGRLARGAASEPWRASGHVVLARFDPAPWWPGGADALLQRGANRLDAKSDFDLVLAASTNDGVYAALAATTGTASVVVADSVLAGIAVQGSATFANTDGRARTALDILAAANRGACRRRHRRARRQQRRVAGHGRRRRISTRSRRWSPRPWRKREPGARRTARHHWAATSSPRRISPAAGRR